MPPRAMFAFFKSIWTRISVEPFMFLFFLGYAIYSEASFPVYYQKICLSTYTRAVCSNLKNDSITDSHVQEQSAMWSTYKELARFLPTVFGTMFIGSLGDHYSTKRPALLSICATLLYMVTYTIVISFDIFPLYSIVIVTTVCACAGQYSSFFVCLFAHLAKCVEDEKQLIFRYAILTACTSAAYVVGGYVTSALYAYMSYHYVMLVGQCILSFTFMWVMLFYPNSDNIDKPGSVKSASSTDENKCIFSSQNSTMKSDQSIASSTSQFSLNSICANVMLLYRSAWITVSKWRPHRGRVYLIVICTVGILYGTEDGGMDTITSLYAYKNEPLGWTPSMLSLWSACMALLQMTVL